ALLTIAGFVAWSTSARALRAFANLGFAIAGPLAAALCALIFSAYLSHVPRAIEDRTPLDAATLTGELRAGRVTAAGMRDGFLVGTFDEVAAEHHGAERFVLSLDGSLRGTELWLAWAAQPKPVADLFDAL